MKTQFFAEPFTNQFGQIINPVDRVACVSTGYSHTVNTFAGIYEGVNKSGDKISSVRVGQIPYRVWKYNYKTGEGKYVDGFRISTLPRKRIFKLA